MASAIEQRLQRDTSFERLYRRHRRDVYGAVLRDVRDPDEAEDVTQIAFMNAFRAMRRGEEPDKPRAWLVTIARNVIRRRYRELARRPQEVALDPEVAATLMEVDGPTAGEIAAAVRRLPDNQRAVILLREIQGRSYAEIAAELELSLAAVETLIFRARHSLSAELELADRVPATQSKRRRGFFFLPLPGLTKLSLAASRLGLAALLGSIVVAVPISDSAAEPPLPPSLQRAPSSAVGAAVAGAPVVSPTSLAPRVAAVGRTHERTGDRPAKEKTTRDKDSSSEGDILGAAPDAPLPLPTIELPSGDDLSSGGDLALPPLPIEPPELPPPPDPLPVPDLP